VACLRPLTGLRRAFERDTRELVRQVASIPGLKHAHSAAALNRALTVQALGRIVIELRKLTEDTATASAPLPLPCKPQSALRRRPYWLRRPKPPLAPRPAFALESDEAPAVAHFVDALAQLYLRPSRPRRLAARRALHQAEQRAQRPVAGRDDVRHRQIQIYLYLAESLMTRLPAISLGQTALGRAKFRSLMR
ncbi:MAG: hypothetical protein B7Y58_10365, partial [Halothiobacillus sp. 35-54-62]